MNSFKIIHQSGHNSNDTRMKMKQALLKTEISKLNTAYGSIRSIASMIKSLQQHFLKNRQQSNQEYQLRCNNLIKKLQKDTTVTLKELKVDNSSYEGEVENKYHFKSIQQGFFMASMRNYEDKNSQLASQIKTLEESLKYYQQNGHLISEEQEQFDQNISSLQFLNTAVKILREKEKAIHQLSVQGQHIKLKSIQDYCRTCVETITKEQICENILLKEMIINHNIKVKVSSLQKEQQALKYKLVQYSKAIKTANQHISRLNLQINISNCNNFLMEADHYSLLWKQMKESINEKMSLNCPTIKALRRSKSCTIMESNLINKEDNPLQFNSSTSIENEESLLDNLDYFISQNFIKDLTEHSL